MEVLLYICYFHRYALNRLPSRRMVHSSNPVQRKRDIPTSLPEGGALIVRARQPYLNEGIILSEQEDLARAKGKKGRRCWKQDLYSLKRKKKEAFSFNSYTISLHYRTNAGQSRTNMWNRLYRLIGRNASEASSHHRMGFGRKSQKPMKKKPEAYV